MVKENTCKSHISLSALCKSKGSVTDKRIETLETHGKRHKCSVKFKDTRICQFNNPSSIQRFGIPVASNSKRITFWQTLVVILCCQKIAWQTKEKLLLRLV